MALKLKSSVSCTRAENKKDNARDCKKSFSKVEALYVALMCFTTHCLSYVTLEPGGRAPLGNSMTKSAAFNALFRRTYNLKIIILVTHVVAGLITTLMMILADRYGIPYLYLPWLVNTMRGMALCEGPALLNLADVLLPNISAPSATFTLITFFLYVEEFFIWNDVFKKFLNCWHDYHDKKKSNTEGSNDKLSTTQTNKLLCEDDTENKINNTIEKSKYKQKPAEFCNKTKSQISMDVHIKSIKQIAKENSTAFRNHLLDMTG